MHPIKKKRANERPGHALQGKMCMDPVMDNLQAQVIEADERARPGRIVRLKWLRAEAPLESYPVPALAQEYFEEARLCWYVGAFVASILMVQLAFEELLRSHYRVARGVGGDLAPRKSVDSAGFADLIEHAKRDGLLSSSEVRDLTLLRKSRNPYVHTKGVGGKGPSFLDQSMKTSAPELTGLGVEQEAKEAIKLLTTSFVRLCIRGCWL